MSHVPSRSPRVVVDDFLNYRNRRIVSGLPEISIDLRKSGKPDLRRARAGEGVNTNLSTVGGEPLSKLR